MRIVRRLRATSLPSAGRLVHKTLDQYFFFLLAEGNHVALGRRCGSVCFRFLGRYLVSFAVRLFLFSVFSFLLFHTVVYIGVLLFQQRARAAVLYIGAITAVACFGMSTLGGVR